MHAGTFVASYTSYYSTPIWTWCIYPCFDMDSLDWGFVSVLFSCDRKNSKYNWMKILFVLSCTFCSFHKLGCPFLMLLGCDWSLWFLIVIISMSNVQAMTIPALDVSGRVAIMNNSIVSSTYSLSWLTLLLNSSYKSVLLSWEHVLTFVDWVLFCLLTLQKILCLPISMANATILNALIGWRLI